MVYSKHLKVSFFFMFSSVCWAGVASNPFLRPGSNRPPPVVNTPPPPPKPAPNPAIAKEVEFRGYFLLKGIPHFCVFNKKSNFGEWIKLTEKTHEEFQAQAFDLESETLTLAFNGQDFTLTLQQSSTSSGLPGISSGLPKVKLPPGVSSTVRPKVMPPRPKSSPKLPDWLSSRISSRQSTTASVPSSPGGFSPSLGSSSSSSSSSRFAPPPRTLSALPGEISDTLGTSQPTSSSAINSSFRNIPPASSSGGSTLINLPNSSSGSSSSNSSPSTVNPGVPVNSSPSDPQFDNNLNDNDQSGLEDLPPPPPPPNILPPSPPPDILPSLDE